MGNTDSFVLLRNEDLQARLDDLKLSIERELQSLAKKQQPTEILTIEEATKFLRTTDTTLRKYTSKGVVKAYWFGGKKLYKRHELEQALELISPQD